MNTTSSTTSAPILVIAASGKTGRRVADLLEQRGLEVRRASRSSAVRFDWDDESTWAPAMEGVESAYVVYTPDLAVPAAPAALTRFTEIAKAAGVRRLVLLSGRGEEAAQACEQIVAKSGLEWTVVRASWFMQNFSEGPFLDLVLSGAIALPVSDVREPFIDIDDIAEVAVEALVNDGHNGEVYEVTGPQLMTFAEIARDLSEATGREIPFVSLSVEQFRQGLIEAGLPQDYRELLEFLFTTVLDGRNESLT
ncbi:MAG: NmrA family NAD(P)-binding protein, partial [Planctomycetota bacterium]